MLTIQPAKKSPVKVLSNGHRFQRIAAIRLTINGRTMLASGYANQNNRLYPPYLSIRWHGSLTPNEEREHANATLDALSTAIAKAGGFYKWTA